MLSSRSRRAIPLAVTASLTFGACGDEGGSEPKTQEDGGGGTGGPNAVSRRQERERDGGTVLGAGLGSGSGGGSGDAGGTGAPEGDASVVDPSSRDGGGDEDVDGGVGTLPDAGWTPPSEQDVAMVVQAFNDVGRAYCEAYQRCLPSYFSAYYTSVEECAAPQRVEAADVALALEVLDPAACAEALADEYTCLTELYDESCDLLVDPNVASQCPSSLNEPGCATR